MQQASRAVADTAADLQGCTLTTGAAAAQMGDDRADKDQRHQPNGHFPAEMHRLDHGVGTLALHLRDAVETHDHQTAHRQQIQHPRMGLADTGGVVDAQMEQRAHQTADTAYQRAHRHPLDQCRGIGQYVCRSLFDPFHAVHLRGVSSLRCYTTRGQSLSNGKAADSLSCRRRRSSGASAGPFSPFYLGTLPNPPECFYEKLKIF